MARSTHYLTLCKQLRLLRKRLLPRKFDPTGIYSDQKLTRAIAYRLLAHAEIESYFEVRVTEIAQKKLSDWKTSGHPSQVLMALLAFSGKQMDEPPRSVDPPQPSQSKVWNERILLDKKIEAAAGPFFHRVGTNHGVKEANLLRLLLPIGFPVVKLDPVWLSEMNSFGARRGLAAHQSFVTHSPDPKDELSKVENLLLGIEQVDEELSKL